MSTCHGLIIGTVRKASRLVSAFKQGVSGAMTIFTVLMLMVMLIGAGIGADFMRYEAYRAELQNALDRGTLAATAFSQTEDPMVVVQEYVDNSVRWGQADIKPKIKITRTPADDDLWYAADTAERTITATAEIEFPTYFIRFLNGTSNDSLSVLASSGTSQRQKRTEIILVLDVSYSMDNWDSTVTPNEERVTILKRAAGDFIDLLLTAETLENTTIAVVPFGGHVNPGPYGPLLTVDDLPFPTSSAMGTAPFCPKFDVTEYAVANADTIDLASARSRVQWFKSYNQTASNSKTGDAIWSWCPDIDSGIVPMSNDAAAIKSYINDLIMTGGTGIDVALKWASYLSSDKSNPATKILATTKVDPTDADSPTWIDPKFVNRPAPDDDSDTNKIIVFLTDGGITHQKAVKDELMTARVDGMTDEVRNGVDDGILDGTVAQLKAEIAAAVATFGETDPDDRHPYLEIFDFVDEDDGSLDTTDVDEIIAHMEATVGENGLLADYWATETSGNQQFNSLTKSGSDSTGSTSDRISVGAFQKNGNGADTIWNGFDQDRTQTEALENVQNLCDRFRARGNVEVHTIGFDISGLTDDEFTWPATPDLIGSFTKGREKYVLGHCAINTNGDDSENRHVGSGDTLGAIFTDISNDIQGLRLTN